MKINYDLKMEEILKEVTQSGKKKKGLKMRKKEERDVTLVMI